MLKKFLGISSNYFILVLLIKICLVRKITWIIVVILFQSGLKIHTIKFRCCHASECCTSIGRIL